MQLTGELYRHGMIRTWLRDRPTGWELTSGAWSPFYYMFRDVPSFPHLFKYSVDILARLAEDRAKAARFDVLVGIASTGIPLAAGVALKLGVPLAVTRKMAGVRTRNDLEVAANAWGEHALVEGRFPQDMRYLLIDDVVTGGASKALARDLVQFEAQKRGVQATYVGTLVVVDRGYPGQEADLAGIHAGHRLYDELPQILEHGGCQREVDVIKHYLEDPLVFSDSNMKQALIEEASDTRLPARSAPALP